LNNLKRVLSLLAFVLFISTFQSVNAQNQQLTNQQVAGKVSENTLENLSLKQFSNRSNTVGLVYIEDSIAKTSSLIKNKRLIEAKAVIEPMVSWLEDVTEYHTNLYKVLKEIDTAKNQADLERELALKSAILRDKAIYQLALLYIEENKPKKAVPGLVDVVRSQPKTQLGFDAYQALQKIGFTYKVQLTETEQKQTDNLQIQK
jgi:hypothetical protein